MCGIVGYIGTRNAAEVLLEGLRRLEYRGYDSAGMAVIRDGELNLRRSVGKIKALDEALSKDPLQGFIGLGHTRWATHGRPSEENAHPHCDCTGRLVVVHNGIIENYRMIRQQLVEAGHSMASETDTEVIAHLVEKHFQGDLQAAVRNALEEIQGVYALVVLHADCPDRLVVARSGPPLVVGLGNGEMFVASDLPAVLHHTRLFVYLDDGDVGSVSADMIRITDQGGRQVERDVITVPWDPILAEKSGYKHFMEKEIHEQPQALADTLRGRYLEEKGHIALDDIDFGEEFLKKMNRCVVVACGTSWHAGLVGQFLLEELAKIPTSVDYGSEFRYRNPIIDDRILAVAISQSGETADTLAAVRECREKKATILSICNVVGSMITRESDAVLYTHAGPEIGVASTKAFTTQIICLLLLSVYLGRHRNVLDRARAEKLLDALLLVPHQVERILEDGQAIEELAGLYYHHGNFLYLGRGIHYPIALE
jgi:glucosamine--fructose-6-phosphate aminotransferase (isomerizing)